MEDSESAEKQENTGIGPASACRGEEEGYCAERSDTDRTYSCRVMRGLDPRIHFLREKFLRRWMDCRVKPGNDSGVAICSTCAPLRTQPTSVRNGDRGNFHCFGLILTMEIATPTCSAAGAHVSSHMSPAMWHHQALPSVVIPYVTIRRHNVFWI
jgi:hypothetical protein